MFLLPGSFFLEIITGCLTTLLSTLCSPVSPSQRSFPWPPPPFHSACFFCLFYLKWRTNWQMIYLCIYCWSLPIRIWPPWLCLCVHNLFMNQKQYLIHNRCYNFEGINVSLCWCILESLPPSMASCLSQSKRHGAFPGPVTLASFAFSWNSVLSGLQGLGCCYPFSLKYSSSHFKSSARPFLTALYY